MRFKLDEIHSLRDSFSISFSMIFSIIFSMRFIASLKISKT